MAQFTKEFKEETIRAYCDFLDEIYPSINLGGYDRDYSYVLRIVDPIMFHIGLSDWVGERDEA